MIFVLLKGEPMKRLLAFASLILSSLAFASIATLAQSRDRDHPTPITSNDISGVILAGNDRYKDYKNDYYYTLTAGPGEVAFTVNAQAATHSAVVGAVLDVYDESSETLFCCFLVQSSGADEQRIRRVTLSKRQQLTLHIQTYDNG